jgi:predicted dinucleotide-binding enzyme
MKIGIIGSGIVGRVLGSAFLNEGHHVTLGSRDPQKEEVQKWIYENPNGFDGTFADAASYGEIIVLATSGKGAQNALELAGKEALKGKIVIDVTNPIADLPPENGVLQFFTGLDESLMERLQKLFPEARFVKAFNIVGNNLMYKPDFDGQQPTMFICGNDDQAKKTVTEILMQFGWETEDMGKMEAARVIEPLCILWCIPGFIHNRWNHAFKLLKK